MVNLAQEYFPDKKQLIALSKQFYDGERAYERLSKYFRDGTVNNIDSETVMDGLSKFGEGWASRNGIYSVTEIAESCVERKDKPLNNAKLEEILR